MICNLYRCEIRFVVIIFEREFKSCKKSLPWQNNVSNIDMTNKNVASHFADVLQKAQIQTDVLQPCDFQITIDVRAIGEAIS